MEILTKKFNIATEGFNDIIDITGNVQKLLIIHLYQKGML